MKKDNSYDVLIIGGSYAGLSAAMALGRALKQVLVIDNGQPCNRQTPFSHNFLTRDGVPPGEIMQIARQQVAAYDTVNFLTGMVVNGKKTGTGFEIETGAGEKFFGKKLIFATGIRDLLPAVAGLQECWGISALHCPYCHGYEVRHEKTGLLGNGEHIFEHSKMIANWTKDLTLFTNGPSALTAAQTDILQQRGIRIVEKPIVRIQHHEGHLTHLVFADDSRQELKALYVYITFEQHCTIPRDMGCQLTKEGYIQTDILQTTTVEGVYACGDNCSRFRTVAHAVASGAAAGMAVSRQLIMEDF